MRWSSSEHRPSGVARRPLAERRGPSWRPVCVMLVLALAGCSGHAARRSDGGGPATALRLAPSPPTVTAQLAAVLDVPHVDPNQCRYAWRLNHQEIYGATTGRLDPHQFRKGDLIGVVVTIPGPDGEPSKILRTEARVANTPPVVRSARVTADPSNGGADLEASTDCWDPDGDPITCSYRWFRNGQPIEGETGVRLPAMSFTRGDRIAVQVVARDGEAGSEPMRSDPFTLDNRAPLFTAQPEQLPSDPGAFRYQARATDPDGDALHFELVKAPTGMTITPGGAIEWALPAPDARQGEYAVTIRATDSKGGEATQDFTIRLSAAGSKL